MDKKYAKENIKLAKHESKDLQKGDYGHAFIDNRKIESNLHKIRKEITSGKAQEE